MLPMWTLSEPNEVRAASQEIASCHHHSHFQDMRLEANHEVIFTFADFDGTEPEPVEPSIPSTVSELAARLVRAEYREARAWWWKAHVRWWEAEYVRELRAACDGAGARWEAYVQAREAMDQASASVEDGEDRGRVKAAQVAALEAAEAWEEVAGRIEEVHHRYRSGRIGVPSRAELYERARVDAGEWVIGVGVRDYRSGLGGPAVQAVKFAMVLEEEACAADAA